MRQWVELVSENGVRRSSELCYKLRRVRGSPSRELQQEGHATASAG